MVSLKADLDADMTGRRSVGVFQRYGDAQRAVDRLSDAGFPVEHSVIVGTDLRLVEDVTGRLTWGRVLAAGAASGAWFGLLIGLLFGLFSVDTSDYIATVVGAVVIAAVFGAIFAAIAYAATRGARDFSSVQAITATTYELLVADEHADRALDLLAGSA